MTENKGRRITDQTTKTTRNQEDQREMTLKIIKGIIKEEIPESAEEHFVLDPNELDGETRFGVKKRKTIL